MRFFIATLVAYSMLTMTGCETTSASSSVHSYFQQSAELFSSRRSCYQESVSRYPAISARAFQPALKRETTEDFLNEDEEGELLALEADFIECNRAFRNSMRQNGLSVSSPISFMALDARLFENRKKLLTREISWGDFFSRERQINTDFQSTADSVYQSTMQAAHNADVAQQQRAAAAIQSYNQQMAAQNQQWYETSVNAIVRPQSNGSQLLQGPSNVNCRSNDLRNPQIYTFETTCPVGYYQVSN